MNYFVYFSQNGVPKPGLTPTWNYLKYDDGSDTTDNPTIAEIGGGYYKFNITFGDTAGPWKDTTKDLVGIIDGGSGLINIERYKPIAITLRGLGLARIAHKGVQNKQTGQIDIYHNNGATRELTLLLSESDEAITRQPKKPQEA